MTFAFWGGGEFEGSVSV